MFNNFNFHLSGKKIRITFVHLQSKAAMECPLLGRWGDWGVVVLAPASPDCMRVKMLQLRGFSGLDH